MENIQFLSETSNNSEVGIHPSAVVHPKAELEKGVIVGAGAAVSYTHLTLPTKA